MTDGNSNLESITIDGDNNTLNYIFSSESGSITTGGTAGPAGPAGPTGPAGPAGAKVSGFHKKEELETKLKNMLESKVNKNADESTPWAVYMAMCGDDTVSVSVGYDASSNNQQDMTRRASEDTITRIFSQTKAITKAAMMCMERDNLLHHTDPINKHLTDFSGVNFKVIRPGKCVNISGEVVDGVFDSLHAKIVESSDNVISLNSYDISYQIEASGNNGLITNQNYALTVGTSRVYFELEDAVTPITLTHLSTHTAGLNNYNSLWAFNLIEVSGSKVNTNVIQRVLQATTGDQIPRHQVGWPAALVRSVARAGLLSHQPGEQFTYSFDNDIQGELLSRVYKNHKEDNTLDEQDMLNELLFDPLGMVDTFYYRTPEHPKFNESYNSYMPAVDFSNNSNGWAERGGGKKLLSDVSNLTVIDTFTTFSDVKGALISGGGGLMSTAKEYLKFLRFLLTGLDQSGNILVPKSLLNSYVREVKQQYGADEFALGPGYGYGANWDFFTSSLIGRIYPDGRILNDDGELGAPSFLINNPNTFIDSDDVFWAGAAGTVWSLDFTNNACHHSVIQRFGSDTPYVRETSAGYRNYFSNEGKRLCENHMKGEGDYVTNNAGFERSVANQIHSLNTKVDAILKKLEIA